MDGDAAGGDVTEGDEAGNGATGRDITGGDVTGGGMSFEESSGTSFLLAGTGIGDNEVGECSLGTGGGGGGRGGSGSGSVMVGAGRFGRGGFTWIGGFGTLGGGGGGARFGTREPGGLGAGTDGGGGAGGECGMFGADSDSDSDRARAAASGETGERGVVGTPPDELPSPAATGLEDEGAVAESAVTAALAIPAADGEAWERGDDKEGADTSSGP